MNHIITDITDNKMINKVTPAITVNESANESAHNAKAPSSLLNRTPIAGAHVYYRSLTFDVHTGINPLIAAAAPLLSLNAKLKHLSRHDDINKLYQNLVHEINAFETNAHRRSYRSETILIARYVICAVLDETISQTHLGNSSRWQQHKLLNTFQHEKIADDRFFQILDRISEDPRRHIDLLELLYLSLSLGFEGKYHHSRMGKIELDKMIDLLYHQIRIQRGEPKALVQPQPIKEEVNTTNKKSSLGLLALQTAITSLLLMMVIYFSFATIFESVTASLQSQHVGWSVKAPQITETQ